MHCVAAIKIRNYFSSNECRHKIISRKIGLLHIVLHRKETCGLDIYCFVRN